MESMDTNNIRENVKYLVEIYSEDLVGSFIEKIVRFKSIHSFFFNTEKIVFH